MSCYEGITTVDTKRVDYMHANIIDSLTAICRGVTVSIQLKRVSKILTSVLAEPLTSIRFI